MAHNASEINEVKNTPKNKKSFFILLIFLLAECKIIPFECGMLATIKTKNNDRSRI